MSPPVKYRGILLPCKSNPNRNSREMMLCIILIFSATGCFTLILIEKKPHHHSEWQHSGNKDNAGLIANNKFSKLLADVEWKKLWSLSPEVKSSLKIYLSVFRRYKLWRNMFNKWHCSQKNPNFVIFDLTILFFLIKKLQVEKEVLWENIIK